MLEDFCKEKDKGNIAAAVMVDKKYSKKKPDWKKNYSTSPGVNARVRFENSEGSGQVIIDKFSTKNENILEEISVKDFQEEDNDNIGIFVNAEDGMNNTADAIDEFTGNNNNAKYSKYIKSYNLDEIDKSSHKKDLELSEINQNLE